MTTSKCDKCGSEPAIICQIVGTVTTVMCAKCRDDLHLFLSTDCREMTMEYQTKGIVLRRAQQIGSSEWEAHQIIEEFMDVEMRLGTIVRDWIAGVEFDVASSVNDWLNTEGEIDDADETTL